MKKIRMDIELLRVVAAVSVVFYHGYGAQKDISYAGLAFFLAISIGFVGRSTDSLLNDSLSRARRLLIPWVVWSGVYLIALGGKYPAKCHGLLACALSGPSVHLWYLPFVCGVGTVISWINRTFSERSVRFGGRCAAILLLVTASLWRDASIGLGYPWAQYAHAAVGVSLGVSFAGFKRLSWLALSYALILLLICWADFDLPGLGVTYAICVFALVIVSSGILNVRYYAPIKTLSGATFGVYLIHPLLLRIFGYLFTDDLLNVVMAAAISFVLVIFAKHLLPQRIAAFVL